MGRREILMSHSKADLVEKILCLEHNNEVLSETVEQQYKNAVELLKQADIFNKTFEESRKHNI